MIHRSITTHIDQMAPEIFLINLSGEIPQVSEIRLRRTDTTLDLSQKAEKGMSFGRRGTNLSTSRSRNKQDSDYGLRKQCPDLHKKE